MTTETLPSSFKFNNTSTIDTGFSKLLIANLFKTNTFKPDITFTTKYTEKMGQIMIRRLGKPAVTLADATAAGGLDFTHTVTPDSLVAIPVKDVIKVSEKIYKAVSALRASGESADIMDNVIAAFREKLQIVWASYLVKPTVAVGDIAVGGASRSASTTEITTYAQLKASVLATRTQIIVNGGIAQNLVLILNPFMEQLVLDQAGSNGNAYVPAFNDKLINDGVISRWFGFNVIVSNLYGTGTPTVLPIDGAAEVNSGDAANTAFVLYDKDTFGIVLNIETIRMREDDGTFDGTFAQCIAITGGGVANPALAIAYVQVASES